MNKRQFTRYLFQEAVEYQDPNSLLKGSLASNISLGGIRLTLHEFVPIGSLLEMQIHLPNPPRNVLVKGKVMWVKELSYGERFEVGLEFIKEPQSVDTLGGYLHARRFEPI